MSSTILVVDDNKELVALLTSLFEDAGYVVIGAAKGRPAIEAAKVSPPAVAIIDMLLPDMMGHFVGDSLQLQVPNLPLIFMSGVFKGSRHSTEAATRFPGAQYFEKPFDAKKLLALVSKLAPLSRSGAMAAAAAFDSTSFDVELDVDVEEPDDVDPMELTGRIRITGGGNISAELRGANLTASRPVAGPVAGSRPSPITRPMPMTIGPKQGELRDNLPGLITAFYLSKETGELHCQKGKVKKVVYFEAGQPVFALSNLAADRFGQFLVRVGKIRPEELQDVAVVAAKSNRRTGDVLVERGLLRDTERLYFVGQQVKSIIYSLFGWQEGSFVVSFREKARSESIKLDVFPGNLIVRGVKKLYKPERLARLVSLEDRLMPSQQPAYQLHEIELEKWEAQLLSKLDGTRTTAEIVTLSGKSDAEACAFLAAMLEIKILERRET
jgi:CheY-like chemotaxis protein